MGACGLGALAVIRFAPFRQIKESGASDPLPSAISRAEASGIQLADAARPVSVGENAAPYWLSAYTQYKTVLGTSARNHMPAEMVMMLAAQERSGILKRMDGALNSVVWSSKLSSARLPDESEYPRDDVLETTVNLSRLLAHRAFGRADGGDVQGAIGDLAALRKLPDLVVQTAGMAAVIAAIRVSEITEGAVMGCAMAWERQPARLAQLRKLPVAQFDPEIFEGVIDREYRSGLHKLRGATSADAWPTAKDTRRSLTTLLNDWAAVRQQMISKDARVIVVNSPESQATARRVALFQGLSQSWSATRAGPHLTQAALSVVQARGQKGAFPKAVPDGTSMADPFGGGRLTYHRTEKGFEIWSLGPDLRDDNGRLSYEVKRQKNARPEDVRGDLVVRYPPAYFQAWKSADWRFITGRPGGSKGMRGYGESYSREFLPGMGRPGMGRMGGYGPSPQEIPRQAGKAQ